MILSLKHITSAWNLGMMEYWNVDLKMILFFYLILFQFQDDFTITRVSIFPEPIIPFVNKTNSLDKYHASHFTKVGPF
jgi:hypothetical protein